jgi:hypothetical protein
MSSTGLLRAYTIRPQSSAFREKTCLVLCVDTMQQKYILVLSNQQVFRNPIAFYSARN